MRKRLFQAISVLLLATSAVPAQDLSGQRDGNWWIRLKTNDSDAGDVYRLAKAVYVAGLIESGIFLGRELATAGGELSVEVPTPDPFGIRSAERLIEGVKAAAPYKRAVERYLLTVTVEQLSDGLDVFYADFRNRGVLVPLAASIGVGEWKHGGRATHGLP
jgi:hypothetical protein